ncbi:MAG: hypothetical protein ACFFKA_02230 [Candidatus Thorarchaeota archaeon]
MVVGHISRFQISGNYKKNNENLYPDQSSIKSSMEGEKLNVSLHQSYLNDTNINFANLSNIHKFSLPCPTDPTFNSSYIEFQVEDIYAPNKTLIVEDDFRGSGEEFFLIQDYYVSFTVNGSGFIENISLLIKLYDILDHSNITIRLYNSEFEEGRIKPKTNLGTIVSRSNVTSDIYYWHKINRIHAFFNSSETYNNTFFFRVEKIGGSVWWDWASDAGLTDGDDESEVLDGIENYVLYGPIQTVDLTLKVDLSPLSNTPKPSEINLQLNNTILSNNEDENKGNWITFEQFTSSSGTLYFEFKTDWWDVACDITKAQINYTKTDLTATTNYEIPEPDLILWNASIDEPITSYDSRIMDYNYIIFLTPANWTEIKVFNGEVQKSVDASSPSIQNYKKVIVLQAENGSNWYLTALQDNRIPENGGVTIPFGNYYLLFGTILIITSIYHSRKKINLI